MNLDGNCDLNIIESSLLELNTLTNLREKEVKLLLLNQRFRYNKQFNKQYKHLNIVFNPEFLTERNVS